MFHYLIGWFILDLGIKSRERMQTASFGWTDKTK